MKAIDTSFNYTDLNSLKEISAKEPSQESLKVAAKQLEGIFLQMVLKSMREANKSFESSMFQSQAKDTYQDFHDNQLALHMAQGEGLGLANVIYEQLKPYVPANPSSENSTQDFSHYQSHKVNVVQPIKVESNHANSIKVATSEPDGFESALEFIEFLKPIAQKAASTLGLNPQFLLAQAALETGWGKHIIKDDKGTNSHNLFNIKANHWQGEKALKSTIEYEQDSIVKKIEPFRMYQNYAESFSDYIDFISKPRYQAALNYLDDAKSFFNHLQQGGFATDPNYADKLLNVLNHEAFKVLGGQ